MDAADMHVGQEQVENDEAKKNNKWALPKKTLVCAFILTGLAIASYYTIKYFSTPEVIMPKPKEKEQFLWQIYNWVKTLF